MEEWISHIHMGNRWINITEATNTVSRPHLVSQSDNEGQEQAIFEAKPQEKQLERYSGAKAFLGRSFSYLFL